MNLSTGIPIEKVLGLAQAIARAEGYDASGSLPFRINNPGDLEIGDIGHGLDAGKTIFPTAEEGWNALYHEVLLMLSGRSHVYSSGKPLSWIAAKYTGNDNAEAWAKIVSGHLGLQPTNTLADYLAA